MALAVDPSDAGAGNGLGGIASIRKIQGMTGKAREKDRAQTLLKMLQRYKKVVELDGKIDAGTLPALDYHGSWALSEVERITG